MRKVQYSSGMKAIMILFHEIFAVVLVISVILLSVMLDRNLMNAGDLKTEDFTDSAYYEQLFYNALEDIFLCDQYREMFETDGIYDPDKEIVLLEYRNQSLGYSDIQSRMETSGAYYLKNLEEWSRDYNEVPLEITYCLHLSQEGVLYQSQEIVQGETLVQSADYPVTSLLEVEEYQRQIILEKIRSQYFYGDSALGVSQELFQILQRVEEGDLEALEGENLIAVLEKLEMLDDATGMKWMVPEERYTTTSDMTLLETYRQGMIDVVELEQNYEALSYALENISRELTTYKRLINQYEKEDTNIRFLLDTERQEAYYSNLDEEERQKLEERGPSQYGKRLGSYFYYNKNDVRLDTTVKGMEDTFYEELEPKDSGKYATIFMAVDTDFPYEDSFKDARNDYEMLRPWAIVSLVTAAVSLFGYFLTFIFLSLAAGRSSRDEEIHLNWFDRIKTEIFFVGFLAFVIAGIFLVGRILELFADGDLIGLMILAGGVTITMVGVFMIFYMSFVRRLKGEQIWKGSLIYWMSKGIYKIVMNWKPSLRILLALGLHTAVIIFLGFLIVQNRSSVAVIFLAVLGFLLLTGMEAVKLLREGIQRNQLIGGMKHIAAGELEYKIDTSKLKGESRAMGEALNTIGDGLYHAVDDSTKNERLKADLITNVSHDIKTPLTSIINYVDLLKREDLNNQRAQGYIKVLDSKSQRLKQLTEDLVEASKISSGNIILQMERLNFVELVYQTAGEFDERFEERGLSAVTRLPQEPVFILADGRRIWRVIENLYNNVAKYAMENTRVYVSMDVVDASAAFSIKNISEQALNIDASELTERFIRGDVSRSTEGSGLGLSIARNLTSLMGGDFDIYLDGDLFKVTVTFPVVEA